MSKGRDKALISARDRKLFERYYYWTEVKRLRFDDALQKLSSEEFFISEGRIMQIIRKMIREGEKGGRRGASSRWFQRFSRITESEMRRAATFTFSVTTDSDTVVL